jgi:hypothetical protein
MSCLELNNEFYGLPIQIFHADKRLSVNSKIIETRRLQMKEKNRVLEERIRDLSRFRSMTLSIMGPPRDNTMIEGIEEFQESLRKTDLFSQQQIRFMRETIKQYDDEHTIVLRQLYDENILTEIAKRAMIRRFKELFGDIWRRRGAVVIQFSEWDHNQNTRKKTCIKEEAFGQPKVARLVASFL